MNVPAPLNPHYRHIRGQSLPVAISKILLRVIIQVSFINETPRVVVRAFSTKLGLFFQGRGLSSGRRGRAACRAWIIRSPGAFWN